MGDKTSATSAAPASAGAQQTRPSRRWLALWRVVVWAMLLLAAFGVLQYAGHAWRVWHMFGQTVATHHTALWRMLCWDGGYLLLAGLTVTVSVGTLMQREWARRGMRVLAPLLALWALSTGVLLLLQWGRFHHAEQMLLAQPGISSAGRAAIAHARRSLITGVVLKFVSVPVLAWLGWRLGRTSVRGQFTRRRRTLMR